MGKQAEALTPLGQKRLQGLHPSLPHACVFTALVASPLACSAQAVPSDSSIPTEQEGRESSSPKGHPQNRDFHA